MFFSVLLLMSAAGAQDLKKVDIQTVSDYDVVTRETCGSFAVSDSSAVITYYVSGIMRTVTLSVNRAEYGEAFVSYVFSDGTTAKMFGGLGDSEGWIVEMPSGDGIEVFVFYNKECGFYVE